jgi:hypothetical protein
LATRSICFDSSALQELAPLRPATAQAVAADIFPCSAWVELSSPAGITPALILVGLTFATTAELGFLYFSNLVPAHDHNIYSDRTVTNTFDSFCIMPVKIALQDWLIFFRITQYIGDTHNTRTLIHTNTRT